MTSQSDDLGEFLDYIWHDTKAFVYLPVHHAPFGPKDWEKRFFSWPRQRDLVIRHVLKWSALGDGIYYAPALFRQARPLKEDVLGSWVLWADFDGNAPKDWETVNAPEPTLRVQSSMDGHEHCYWQLDSFLSDVGVLEDRNRAISYVLRADTSGWDADQILRPVGTRNNKRDMPVFVRKWTK